MKEAWAPRSRTAALTPPSPSPQAGGDRSRPYDDFSQGSVRFGHPALLAA
jgi:hypothetical protein